MTLREKALENAHKACSRLADYQYVDKDRSVYETPLDACDDSDLVDFFADAMHLCRLSPSGIDFEECLRIARDHFTYEVAHPDEEI